MKDAIRLGLPGDDHAAIFIVDCHLSVGARLEFAQAGSPDQHIAGAGFIGELAIADHDDERSCGNR